MKTTQPTLSEQVRQAMSYWPSGVTVIAARYGEETRGMTASSFTSVSLEPPLILVCINEGAQLWPVLEQAGRFTVNLLAEGHEHTSAHFSGRPLDGYQPLTDEDSPALEGALATLYCRTWAVYPGGTHKIVVGEVKKVALGSNTRPLLYWNRSYRQLP
ncbi:MAG: 4-hydroxyphenylacetate 3-monooxygenase reductase component [Meiothermus sp.]|uniref:4-hydroxyphenylacetate 3-monooxygenase reductase component n=2 Tax=Meiothermus hypogaeus TaxID=884155 RepID=A0A511R0H0_9DEIN|nr:4-hydroxyphenylacetate 3-monooxygenase reductase subunit [Meiothermus hypogaeus]RIH77635.1 4-hydroxyphenylacetate 3-monooxygenase reductase component [Meiothermus hypogaeus]GEM83121.1 4-hydroxyphenylacetate 3-monooxygenase reductase component [Meiothermus hypogaeus NBRC 106114]GIW38278.1 MAG: 4-hydroxyphenylacetate 3-monooxygenase reductase component [Meiothermus sp.]